jgi:hypothetical protein
MESAQEESLAQLQRKLNIIPNIPQYLEQVKARQQGSALMLPTCSESVITKIDKHTVKVMVLCGVGQFDTNSPQCSLTFLFLVFCRLMML